MGSAHRSQAEYHGSASSRMAGSALKNLLLSIAQVLVQIFLGYACTKTKFVGSVAGVGEIVGKFALPALFLLAGASLDLGSFKFEVMAAVTGARFIMIFIATGATKLLDRQN